MRTFGNCRRQGVTILAAAASLAMGAAVHATPAYQGISLYPLAAPTGGTVGTLQGINGGQTFGSVQIGSNTLASIWGANGWLTVLQPSNLGYYSGSMVTVALPGMQGGYAVNSDTNQNHAVIWTGAADTAVDLNPNVLYGYYTSQINAASGNQQVGSGASVEHGNHGLIWSGTPDSAIDVNPAGALGSVLLGTDRVNQVGYSVPSQFGTDATMWSGTADSYVSLAGPNLLNSEAVAVSGGQEVGSGNFRASAGEQPTHAILWTGTADSAVDLHPSSAYWKSWAVATNGVEQVGYVWPSPDYEIQYAFLWQGSAASAVNLQQLLPAGLQSSKAFSIDASGDVYGVALDNWGVYHAVEWTPVPEPAGVVAVIIAGWALMSRRRIRREK
ncbi:MAG TPA: PEP-CTERM sorting domain-containing protein [Tepidisphaeraceae bacterium]|nr:PEP-CTERM sorting domain-containing protein [Tepidisphaeraceae bacterium]